MMQGMWHIYALVFMPERMAIQKIIHPNYWIQNDEKKQH